jgi:diguanylate cyclase (GGDEF)-like protein
MQTMPDHAGHRTMSLIMIDIDHFKKVNDVYGHQAGDYVIKTVAQLMRETFRKTDVVSRYGGEEFLAILPGTDVPGSLTAAEKLRTRVEEHEFVFDGKKMPIRVSSGVAQFRPTLESADETIARADSALYFSKENGRNRVSFHDGDKINTLLDAMSA